MKNIFSVISEKQSAIVLLITFAAITVTGFNSYYHADDFNSLKNIADRGLFGDAYFQYLNWDGRVISPLFIIRNLLLINLPPEVIVILALLGLPVLSFLIVKILTHFEFVSKTKDLIPVFLISILFWFAFRAHIARSIYWVTGSYYMFANVLYFLWIYFYLTGKRNVLFLLVTFTVISSGVNIASSLITLVFLMHIFNVYKVNLKNDLSTGVVAFVGFLLSALAPGNFERARMNYSGITYNVLDFPGNFWIVAEEYILMSKWIPLAAMIAAAGIHHLLIGSGNNKQVLKAAFIFLLSGFASIAPFMLVPESASRHTVIHFQTFIFVSVLMFSLSALSTWHILVSKWFSTSVISLVAAILLYTAFQQYQMGRNVKKLVLDRYRVLENLRGQKEPVYLKAIDQPYNFFTNRGFDIKSPPDDINDILQSYYGTGPVLLK